MRPVTQSDGHEFPRLIDELVPGEASHAEIQLGSQGLFSAVSEEMWVTIYQPSSTGPNEADKTES